MSLLPKPEAFAREAIILIGGALLAALILRQFPKVQSYIKDSSCNCGG